ncbi:MAG: beta-lactamase family protein [Anaerolineae bacterium]|nr:beta-lactamase family protein [Anaerolineae bacterium]
MNALATAVDAVVQAQVGRTFPACSVCVAHGGRVVLEKAWGWLDPETRLLPAQANTLFDFASLTKLVTTTALLALLGKHGLGVDTPLVEIVPEFGAVNPRGIDGGQDPHSKDHLPTPAAMEGQQVDVGSVTLRHLLTHTSGLPPWRDVYKAAGPAPAPPGQPDPLPHPARWANALAALVQYPFVAPPDGVVRYSDIGLLLLGEAVARLHASGDLEAAIRRQVIDSLPPGELGFNPVGSGMKAREQTAPTEDDPTWRKRRVWGEVHDENACGVGGVAGHAGLFGTARALAAFGLRWQKEREPFGVPAAVRDAAISEQATTGGVRRGLGFALKAAEDSMAGDRLSMASFGHSGFTGTTLWIDPEAELVIAVLTNSVYYGRHSEAYARTHTFRRALHDAIAEACEG